MTQGRTTTLKLLVLTAAVWSAVWLGFENQQPRVVRAGNKPPQAVADNDRLIWLDNYDAALQEAKKTGKPIFLEFRCAP